MIRSNKIKKSAAEFVTYFILILACIVTLSPIVWAISTSLKDVTQALSYPPEWIPNPITLKNYWVVFFETTMPRYFLNSIISAIGTILVTVCVAAHAAYACARFNFPGKNAILFFVLAAIMIPGISILIPVYLIGTKVGLHNTYLLLILVFSAWQTPAAIWLLKGFFETIPSELDESALIDGCSRLKAFYRVTLPLSGPGLAASTILVFVYVWNNFLLGFSLTATDDMRLIIVGLYMFVSHIGIEWQYLMAGVVIALCPVLVFFVVLQKRFIQGLTSGALKG